MLQKFKITCFDILEGNLYKGRDKFNFWKKPTLAVFQKGGQV